MKDGERKESKVIMAVPMFRRRSRKGKVYSLVLCFVFVILVYFEHVLVYSM